MKIRNTLILILCFLLTVGLSSYSLESKNIPESPTIIFKRVFEPREKAFSLLIPNGWQIEGGIFRINPSLQGGAAQSIAAKCDFAVKSDQAGSNMIRWLPDMLYFDMRNTPAAAMFPQGSNYNGMKVLPKMNPADFIKLIVIPYAHPNHQHLRIIDRKELPKLEKIYLDHAKGLSPLLTMNYYAEIVSVQYSENGKEYSEKIISVIEDYGKLGAGLWGNKQTFLIRTPKEKYDEMAPLFSIIQNSVEFDFNWLIGEIKGQISRNEIMSSTLKTMQNIDAEIVEHQQKTNAEIHHDMFRVLNDQEEYINPFTKKTEIGSNQWKNRWVSESGTVIYTDIDDYNPNNDWKINHLKYYKTPVKRLN